MASRSGLSWPTTSSQWQVSVAAAIAAYEFVRKEDDRFSSADKRRDRSILARTLLRYPGREAYDVVDADATGLLDYFEDLGLMVKKRIAPPYFVWTTSYYYIVHWWEALAEYVRFTRKEDDDENYYTEFEDLYKTMIRQERKQRRRNVSASDAKALRDFLQDEVHAEIRQIDLDRGDLGAIVNIEAKSFTSEAYPATTFEELAKHHSDGFLVATIFDRIVGYAVGYVDGTAGEIDSMAVDPNYRRLGIARKLLERLCTTLKYRGATKFQLEVRVMNSAAVKLYEKFGFVVAEQVENYYGPGEDAYRMIAKSVTLK